MLSAERGVMDKLEWDEGFAMPVADSSNMQLQKQVTNKLNFETGTKETGYSV